ncbi:MAG: alpha/beta hydrolase [Lachnospiraceae bacterium]|nr:alpha/beta hydrolase [Lachnospiraceae bacterium]
MYYIQLNGQIIAYEKSGFGPRPFLLLHGNGEDHHIFDELVRVIDQQKFTIYAIDSRGHGASAEAKDLHYLNFALDVSRFITSLELEDVFIVGFSDGAIIALILASLHPDMLSGMIICGANRNPDGLTPKAIRMIRSAYRKDKNPLTAMMLSEPNILDRDLKRISVPVLVLAGEHDMIKKEETEAITRALPNSRMEILPGESHDSYVVHSEKLLPFINRFYKEHLTAYKLRHRPSDADPKI